MKKLELFEVQFILEAIKGTSIKAIHAPQVTELMNKLEEEQVRLSKLENKE